MQIDTGILIGRKCGEFAEQLSHALLQVKPAPAEVVDLLNGVADQVCCGLNALAIAARAETVEDFAQRYDRACDCYEDAASSVRLYERTHAHIDVQSAV